MPEDSDKKYPKDAAWRNASVNQAVDAVLAEPANAVESSGVSLAAKLAETLAAQFLLDGNYATGRRSSAAGATAASAYGHSRSRNVGFGDLGVQSVGFEDGVARPGVHIYLTRGSARVLKSLPGQIDGIDVHAHRIGRVTVRPEAAASLSGGGRFYHRHGRVACGSSCAPTSEKSAGTFGAIVKVVRSDQLHLLSNNHVFAGCNHVKFDEPIVAPSNSDASGAGRASVEIGRHHQIQPLHSGDPYFVSPCDADLALARVANDAAVSSWQGDSTDGYDTPMTYSSPLSAMAVKKFGRTTGLTHGVVEAKISAPMPVVYQAQHFKGVVWFKDVWTVRGVSSDFALPGDSGSLVVSQDGGNAVGLVFAVSEREGIAYIIPMPGVMRAFGGLELVTGHGVVP